MNKKQNCCQGATPIAASWHSGKEKVLLEKKNPTSESKSLLMCYLLQYILSKMLLKCQV